MMNPYRENVSRPKAPRPRRPFRTRSFLALTGMVALPFVACSRDTLETIVPPLDNGPHAQRQAQKVGAGAGIALHGKQNVGLFGIDNEPYFEAVHVPAGTPTIVYSAPVPSNGEILSYNSIVQIRYDESDASVPCDGGQCIATIRRYLSGEFANSVVCRGGGTCSGTGLTTGIDTAIDPAGDVPTSGPLNACTAPIIWTGTTYGVYVTCPMGVWVSGMLSGFHSKDPGPFDSGADAADAADAADSADSALAPTITSVTPPYAVFEGNTTLNLVGTHYQTTGHLTTVAANGVTCGSVTPTSDTTATCVTGASAVSNGTGHANLTVSDGVTTNTLTNGWCYLPPLTNTAFDGGAVPGQWHDSNFGLSLSGSNVTAWADLLGSRNYSPEGTDFVVTSNWLSSGKNALTSAATGGMSTGVINHANKVSVCQVRTDTGTASKIFWSSGNVTGTADVAFTETVNSTGTYAVGTGAGGTQNYGNSTAESRSAMHSYCFTFDMTVGSGTLAGAEYVDGTLVSSTTGATPAMTGNALQAHAQYLFSDHLNGSLVNGSIALETVAEMLWSATQVANAEKCFNLEYTALP